MFALFYEPRHRVVLVQVSGVLSSDDIAIHDRVLLSFLADKSDVRAIYDLSGVETLAIPASKIAQRGQRPAIVTGRRIVVSSDQGGAEFARVIADEQRAAGLAEPTIVPALEEAYVLLGLDLRASFKPVELS
jgi:hypothetical protein